MQLARDQLIRVLQSYERRDVALALNVWRKDQEIDALNTSLFRELLTYMMEDPRNITFCTHMLGGPDLLQLALNARRTTKGLTPQAVGSPRTSCRCAGPSAVCR